jgi:murein L,D-transpeptidase YcbB/YkuD
MNDFRFTLVSVFIFIVIIGLGVLAFFALEPGSKNGSRQMIRSLESDLAEKDEALQEALRRIAELESDNEQLAQDEEEVVPDAATSDDDEPEEEGLSADSPLLSSLTALRSRGVLLEPGDQGADVGTIQTFLNEYEGKTGGVDNDFGPTTRKRVEAFQKGEGLTVDGGVGSGTLGKMIEWLENNQ